MYRCEGVFLQSQALLRQAPSAAAIVGSILAVDGKGPRGGLLVPVGGVLGAPRAWRGGFWQQTGNRPTGGPTAACPRPVGGSGRRGAGGRPGRRARDGATQSPGAGARIQLPGIASTRLSGVMKKTTTSTAGTAFVGGRARTGGDVHEHLYWDQRGAIACERHAPIPGSDTFVWNDWRPITTSEAEEFAGEVGRPPACETCAAIRRRG